MIRIGMRPLVLDHWFCLVVMGRPPNPYANVSGTKGSDLLPMKNMCHSLLRNSEDPE